MNSTTARCSAPSAGSCAASTSPTPNAAAALLASANGSGSMAGPRPRLRAAARLPIRMRRSPELIAGHRTTNEAGSGSRDQLVGPSCIWRVGVLPQNLIRSSAARPRAHDDEMARIVEILDQLVGDVAVETRHIAPDRLGDCQTLLADPGGKERLAHGEDRHRTLLDC